MLAVTDKAQKVGHHELRSLARTGGRDGGADHLEAVDQVIADGASPGNPVSRGARHEIGAGELTVVRGGVRKLVVGHDDDDRKFLHSGHVHPLMETSRGSTPLADAGGADGSLLAPEALCHESAADGGDHRAKMADHGVVPLRGAAAVDIAVAPAHGAE